MYYIGLISGTSMDAVEGVLVDFDSTPPAVAAATSRPYPEELRLALKQARAQTPLAEIMALDAQVAELFAVTARQLLTDANISAEAVAAIGSHGQTVWHSPATQPAWTLQIGDANRIAYTTGITTVADFRRMDMAAGGEGAPLVPIFHAAWLQRPGHTRIVLNLGGIANITVLPGDKDEPVSGFDTGPANTLLDAWAWRYRQTPCDEDGRFAARGRVIPALLEALLADPYFQQPAPKSTGPEYFNLDWLARLLEEEHQPADVQATLVELTARSVAAAVQRYAPEADAVIACGGGVHNPVLMTALAAALAPVAVSTSADYGLPPDKVEALCFAWLARERLAGQPGNLPAVTGASEPVILGGIYQPR
ncbi:anhydro-N-acetylmuramic acid kinase [Methylohalomonas lacus]|uniref:Anhydro-N-acetylmuramic acid kinase n=1 Tax=Methylohalomonas lacus TaxID=398773 RepID=A0AAE3HM40_9GAMM|nr:anhydro-N-acetylmuramic acid kinase [Methylohalomonas lacus]MCS3903472.1 anhydro-N-acetylmuramic acid kinase [Methylohalomonas lacus]